MRPLFAHYEQICINETPIMTIVRLGALVVVMLSGFLIAFLSQASSPDYRRIFWMILPIALVHLALSFGYSFRVRHWTRWLILCVAIIAMASYGEMTVRVWL
jgi:hypothetical protein